MAQHVLVIGAGLAGLATAAALAPRGCYITLLEGRSRAGGRASSFTDTVSGQLLDTCQHVSMGCCTNFAHFCRTVGIAHLLRLQYDLAFMTPDRRVSQIAADHFPAPLHLARSFLTAHFLSPSDKLRIAWGLAWLCFRTGDTDPPFLDWLQRHHQTPSTIDRFWGLVLTSALNETVQRVGLRYARKVFVDAFLRHRKGFQVELPTVPLGLLYGAELDRWRDHHPVRLLLSQGARRLLVGPKGIQRVELRDGSTAEADWYVAAVPFDRLLDLLPPDTVQRYPCFANLRRLETSPITSLHLWYDRPLTHRPNVVLVGCASQWLFNRGQTAPGEHYVQVVVSAARDFRGLGQEEVQRRIAAELQALFPVGATLLRGRVVTEHAATFSAVPGVDRWRPAQGSPLPNLLLAGDWTNTGWPATMEGAVRSGYLAAEELLRRRGTPERLLQPDL